MPRSRPTSNPVSYHKHTKRYYVTRGGKRIYLGTDKEEAVRRYHEMGLGYEIRSAEPPESVSLTAKELANRFLAAQRANWGNPEATLKSYKDWLGRFLTDHPRLRAANFSAEAFADWKLSLKRCGYSAESINHYLSAVRAMFRVAEDAELIAKPPKLRRVRNEPRTGGEVPALLRLQAEVRNMNSGTAPTYREARKDISSLLVCQLGDGLGVESAPLTAHVSKALAFISRSISA